jgi:hypothetical protein
MVNNYELRNLLKNQPRWYGVVDPQFLVRSHPEWSLLSKVGNFFLFKVVKFIAVSIKTAKGKVFVHCAAILCPIFGSDPESILICKVSMSGINHNRCTNWSLINLINSGTDTHIGTTNFNKLLHLHIYRSFNVLREKKIRGKTACYVRN